MKEWFDGGVGENGGSGGIAWAPQGPQLRDILFRWSGAGVGVGMLRGTRDSLT